MKEIRNRPVYSIGVVAELLGVHPETIRVWERSGVIRPPYRRRGKRMFSEDDLRRLQFVQRLAGEGLSLRAMHFYLRLYPCWHTYDCSECLHGTDAPVEGKPCWKETGWCCQAPSNADLCATCSHRPAELAPAPAQGTWPDHILPENQPEDRSGAESIPARSTVRTESTMFHPIQGQVGEG